MTAEPIKILHVDDDRDHHELVKAQLRRFSADITLERADSRRSAMAALKEAVYDCILTDDRMPENAGLGWLRELRRRGNVIPFVILAELDADDGCPVRTDAVPGDEFHALVDHFHFDMLNYWIHRLDGKYRELIRSDRLKADLFQTSPGAIAELREAAKRLTSRESQILDMIGAGKSNMDISRELFISYKTAKNHVSNIFAKLGIHSRAEAIHYVMMMRLTGGA